MNRQWKRRMEQKNAFNKAIARRELLKTRQQLLVMFAVGILGYIALVFFVCMCLVGCSDNSIIGTGPQGPAGPQGIPGIVVSSPPSQIQAEVAQYNAGRAAIGQDPVTAGLSCTLSTVPATTTCLATSTGPSGCVAAVNTTVGSFLYGGVFNQVNQAGTAGFNILPSALQPDYTTNFRVTCSGLLFVVDDSWHNMSLSSDDGSVVRVNNLVLNNDGEHSIQTVSGVVYLNNLSPYSFSLDYFQGPGNVALILQEDGLVMSQSGFYH